MKDIWVRKQDGRQEKFNPLKVKRALRRSGLSAKETEIALKLLNPKLQNGISTKKIYALVYGIIRSLRPEVTHKFNLKHALLLLGPAGYEFEDFISNLFKALGYSTQVRQIPIGKCVTHEVDVIAKKGKEKLMVECKFRNEPGTRCRVQTILYVYSRFMDLRAGAKLHSKNPFTKACLATNAKFPKDVTKPHNNTPYPGDTNPDQYLETANLTSLLNGVPYSAVVRNISADGSESKPSNIIHLIPMPSGEFTLQVRYKGVNDGFEFASSSARRAD